MGLKDKDYISDPPSEGAIFAILKHIDEKLDRLVWRADQTEKEIEAIRTRLTVLETMNIAKENSLAMKLLEKASLVFLGVVIMFIAKKLGLA